MTSIDINEAYRVNVLTFNLFQVDVKCTQPGDGGYYYPDHLPVLGTYRLCLMEIPGITY